MRLRRLAGNTLLVAAVFTTLCSLGSNAWAQGGGGGGGGNNQNSGIAGVVVDANGVLSKVVYNDQNGVLHRQRVAAALSALGPNVAHASDLRMVSLNRLEAAVREQLEKGARPTEAMRYLAGLTRVQYVFFYPDSKDIVLAGPAEAWVEDASGRPVGVESNRPVLELQDLVVALRMFAPDAPADPVIGCSIDPTQEGLARMQQFLREIGSRATPGDTQFIVEGLRTSLGLQQVRVLGVPPDTHFAQVMVEADYRMKLIGIGLERPPVKMKSYVDQVDPATANKNALQRWFFLPDYACVRATDDSLGMELVGEGVKLVGEDEMVGPDGQRISSGRSNKASQRFVATFTEKYPQLAARSPVYAQLRNLIDMAVAAAFIKQQDFFGKAGWAMDVFGREDAFPVQTFTTPVQVDTVVTSIWKGRRLMTPVGGGVHIEPNQALASEHRLPDEGGKLKAQRDKVTLELAPGQWWWDQAADKSPKR